MGQSLANTLRKNLSQALRCNNLEDAASALERLKSLEPLSRETRGLELEYLLKIREYKSAAGLASQLIRLFPDSGKILFLAGQVYYRLKDYKRSVAFFAESNKIHSHMLTDYWRARALTQMGLYGEAAPILESVARQQPRARLDLGWMYERQRKWQAALDQYGLFLNDFPDNQFVIDKVAGIKAQMLSSQDLIEEMDELVALNDEIPAHLLPPLVEKLLKTANVIKARDVIREHGESLKSKYGVDASWICYRHKAYDLALELFVLNIGTNLENFKYLNALEMCAGKCHRTAEIKTLYENFAANHKPLYGRMRRL